MRIAIGRGAASLRPGRAAPERGAAAARAWSLALGGAAALAAVWLAARLAAAHRAFGVVPPLEGVGAALAVALGAAALALRIRVMRAPERFAAAPLAARAGFVRGVALALAAAALAVAFSRMTGIVGRFAVHELAVLLGAALLLLAAPRIDAPLARLGRMRGVALVELVAGNALLALLLAEVFLRVWLALGQPPPWLAFGRDAFTYKLPPSGDPTRPPNPQGYVDGPFRQERIPGVRRVVVLGDSFCAGHVRYEANWLTLADDWLGGEVELYNLGIHNTGPREYLEVLEREGLSYAPDLVLVSFYVGNDVDYGYVAPHPLYKESLRLWHVGTRLAALVGEWRSEAGTVGDALMHVEADVVAGGETFQLSAERYLRQQRRHLRLCRRRPDADDEREWAVSLDAVARIAARCRERGVAVALVVSPDAYQTEPEVLEAALAGLPGDPRHPPWHLRDFDLAKPQERLARFAAEQEIPFLDLLPAFAQARARGQGPFFLERNNHWNQTGNRVAALALAERLPHWLREIPAPAPP